MKKVPTEGTLVETIVVPLKNGQRAICHMMADAYMDASPEEMDRRVKNMQRIAAEILARRRAEEAEKQEGA